MNGLTAIRVRYEGLKDERKSLGLTCPFVAGVIGVSRQMYEQYERGATMPAESAEKIKTLFNTIRDLKAAA